MNKNFSIDDVKARFLDLTDELDSEILITLPTQKESHGPISYLIRIKCPWKAQPSAGLAKAKTARLAKVFEIIDELYKTFDSMGLELRFDFHRMVTSAELIFTLKSKKED